MLKTHLTFSFFRILLNISWMFDNMAYKMFQAITLGPLYRVMFWIIARTVTLEITKTFRAGNIVSTVKTRALNSLKKQFVVKKQLEDEDEQNLDFATGLIKLNDKHAFKNNIEGFKPQGNQFVSA